MLMSLFLAHAEDERKLLCQLLPKLYITEEADDFKAKALLVLIGAIKQHRPLADAVSKNALNKFEAGLVKTFGERLDALDVAEVKANVAVEEMQAYITSVLKDTYGDETSEEEEGSEGSEELELDDDEEEEEGGEGGGTDEETLVRKQAPRSARKPRGGTREFSTEEESEEEKVSAPPPTKGKGEARAAAAPAPSAAKKGRSSKVGTALEGEKEEKSEEESTEGVPPPARKASGRGQKGRKALSSEEEEESEESD